MSKQPTLYKPAPPSRRLADRELAKLGLALSLGALVATGLNGSPSARKWHLLAAGAMVSLGAWHVSLYRPSGKGRGDGRT